MCQDMNPGECWEGERATGRQLGSIRHSEFDGDGNDVVG